MNAATHIYNIYSSCLRAACWFAGQGGGKDNNSQVMVDEKDGNKIHEASTNNLKTVEKGR